MRAKLEYVHANRERRVHAWCVPPEQSIRMSDVPPWVGVTEEEYIPEIRKVFAARLREHADALYAAREDLRAEGPAAVVDAADRAHRIAHSIKGTAATLLGHDLGAVAGQLADTTSPWVSRPQIEPEVLQRIQRLSADLTREVERYLGWVDMEEGRTEAGPPPESP